MIEKQTFGPYEIIAKLAEGEFSQIFHVIKDKNAFALKKLKPYLKYDHEYTALIENEASLLSKISNHEHFPKIFDHGKINNENYLVLELLEGISLARVNKIDNMGKAILPVPLVCKIILEIGLGLKHLHSIELNSEKPCIHADLRPSNVMVTQQGNVKLIDLGLKGGTFMYMPLQRLHSRQVNPYTDIYATGHILYELLHGKPLFHAKTKYETYEEMRQLKIQEDLFNGSLPLALRKILVNLLKQEGEIFYKSASSLIEDLQKLIINQKYSVDEKELGDWIHQFQKNRSS